MKRIFLLALISLVFIPCKAQIVVASSNGSGNSKGQEVTFFSNTLRPSVELWYGSEYGYKFFSDTRHLTTAPMGNLTFFLGVDKASAVKTIDDLLGLFDTMKNNETISLKAWGDENVSVKFRVINLIPFIEFKPAVNGDTVDFFKKDLNRMRNAILAFEEPFPVNIANPEQKEPELIKGTVYVKGEPVEINSVDDLRLLLRSLTIQEEEDESAPLVNDNNFIQE